jgi:hypothetical protein
MTVDYTKPPSPSSVRLELIQVGGKRNMGKKVNYLRKTDKSDDSFDAPEDYADTDLNAPKRSPMRRKEKSRSDDYKKDDYKDDYKPIKDHKDRRRKNRHKPKYDFEF